MDVLLVNPPDIKSKYKDVLGLTAPPLGLAYIGAVLEQNDVKVTILDAPALDMDIEGYQRKLDKMNVDLLGVQTTTPTIRQALAVGRITTVSYTHLRAHETDSYLVCRLLLEKKKILA